MSYINHTTDLKLYGWVGDSVDALQLNLYVDADLAGDTPSCKSTSGVFFAVCGPHTRWPITGQSKKQPVTSHSTPESEVVAFSRGLRTIGLPAVLLWSTLLGKGVEEVVLQVREDNDAMIRVLTTGRNPTMRYLSLTHGIKINWLHQVSTGPNVKLSYVESALQAADIFTKTFENGTKWVTLLPLINVSGPNEFWPLVNSHRNVHIAAVVQHVSFPWDTNDRAP